MKEQSQLSGQGIVEYALIMVGVAVVVILVLNVTGLSLRDVYCEVVSGLGSAACEANGCSYTFDASSDLDAWEGKNMERFAVEGGKACITGNGSSADSYLNSTCTSDLESSDYSINFEDVTVDRVVNNNKNTGFDVWFRAEDDKNGYLFIYNSRTNRMRFWKVVNGKWIKLSEAKVPSEWQSQEFDLNINVEGDTFTAYKDGQAVLSAKDSAYTEGTVGIRNKPSSKSCIGNMEVGNIQ